MRIGLDYDGVITDSRAQKHDLALARYGVEVPTPVFKWAHAVHGGLLTPDQYRDVQHIVHTDREANQGSPLLDGLREYLPRIMARHCTAIVTARDGDALRWARYRLEREGLNIRSVGVGHGRSKRDATRGLDVFVDDDLDKLADLEVPHRFLFTHEYNLHETLPEGIVRAYSWADLYRKIGRIAEVNT